VLEDNTGALPVGPETLASAIDLVPTLSPIGDATPATPAALLTPVTLLSGVGAPLGATGSGTSAAGTPVGPETLAEAIAPVYSQSLTSTGTPATPVLPALQASSTGTSGSPVVNANAPVDETGTSANNGGSSRTGTLVNANAPVNGQAPTGAGSPAIPVLPVVPASSGTSVLNIAAPVLGFSPTA
jgi:hypothetical protein